jgi:hypothetical protein
MGNNETIKNPYLIGLLLYNYLITQLPINIYIERKIKIKNSHIKNIFFIFFLHIYVFFQVNRVIGNGLSQTQ